MMPVCSTDVGPVPDKALSYDMKEIWSIIRTGFYYHNARRIELSMAEYEKTRRYSLAQLNALLRRADRIRQSVSALMTGTAGSRPGKCRITLLNRDVLTAAEEYETGKQYRPLVITSDFQQLLDRSTLAVPLGSIRSNVSDNPALSSAQKIEPACIIYFPHVAVLRDRLFCLRSFPYMISVAAIVPERYDGTPRDAIRALLLSAAGECYDTLFFDLSGEAALHSTLAASETVRSFYQILVNEHYADMFRQIFFTIREKDDSSKKIRLAFTMMFENVLHLDII
jgi:hypothetical protein